MRMKTWTRRQFLALSGAVAAAHAVPGRGFALSSKALLSIPMLPRVSARAADLYAHAFVLDANTLASIGQQAQGPGAAHRLATIRASGVRAFKSTLGGSADTFEQAIEELGVTQSLFDRHPAHFLKVVRAADLDRGWREDKVAVILSFEAASMLEGRIARIELFRRFDVLVMQLTYNHRTAFGCGCLDGDSDGLTALGRQAVARMNAIGVALDLSHANTRTTADGIAVSERPAVITHAGCRAVYDHPRNKPDRVLRALADKGGVMGVYMLPFLTPANRQPELPDYMRHMLHALKVCGEDHVGIGTDSMFFTVKRPTLRAIRQDEIARRKAGVGAPGENRPPYLPDVNTPRKLEYVADALLRHGYGARVADKVLGRNFRRVFGEIWTA